jgi:MFS family permease
MTNNDQNQQIANAHLYNFILNIFEGGIFGLAIGISSQQTILPLFVSQFTDSAILIGLIPAIHLAGWQLPQLFLANRVAKQKRYKRVVLAMTIHERLPFLGLALAAWFSPAMSNQTLLIIIFLMLIWQGLGGGVTAIAWQSLISKIIFPSRWGTFFGLQGSFFNLLAAAGAVFAGYLLELKESPLNFTLCFIISFAIMGISWILLVIVREPEKTPPKEAQNPIEFRNKIISIIKLDKNFRWYLVGRMMSSLAIMGFAFYTVYAVNEKGVSELEVGIMTGILLGIQILINPILGWLGDRWDRRIVMVFGMLAATISSIMAVLAQNGNWFYFIFLLAGIANAATWALGITMTLDFASEEERPAYIGLANTLSAPAFILIPFLGGWLADLAGYPAAFFASAIGGIAAMFVFQIFVKDPRKFRAFEEITKKYV